MILYGHYIQSYPNIYNHHMQQQKNKLHLKTLTDKVSLKRCFSWKKLILKQKQTWVNLSSLWFRLHFYHVVYVSTVKCIDINFLTITLFYHQRTQQKIYALYVLSLFTLKGNEILQNEDEQLIFFLHFLVTENTIESKRWQITCVIYVIHFPVTKFTLPKNFINNVKWVISKTTYSC